ncbi:cartilage intermediate layer protein 2-like [Kryptolebias marmoratus]|uniref:cartilage intermediate layer protein 2 n=1 Tax=Kryptolebias marmoratus TaxID=37003 RepID=UPI0007F8DD56|nr:cartilage intermediate layer protein 2 [Kryptolebias marmoratus]XP_017273768.1 cartilage intermediate layer protein 2 [Kryptolebias marmoratus]XP_017273769.1 cartilage intermediate layer protein 2-like [Kryptolebias marmoratus]
MIQQLILTFAAFLVLGYIEPSHQQPESANIGRLCWTRWFNRDRASGKGDWESLKLLREDYPGEICRRPVDIQAVTARGETPAEQTKQKFYAYNTNSGFICRNQDQKRGRCFDYKVRFRCPCKFEV